MRAVVRGSQTASQDPATRVPPGYAADVVIVVSRICRRTICCTKANSEYLEAWGIAGSRATHVEPPFLHVEPSSAQASRDESPATGIASSVSWNGMIYSCPKVGDDYYAVINSSS
jgi:hypothetical protein